MPTLSPASTTSQCVANSRANGLCRPSGRQAALSLARRNLRRVKALACLVALMTPLSLALVTAGDAYGTFLCRCEEPICNARELTR